jgi:hypothetical protein
MFVTFLLAFAHLGIYLVQFSVLMAQRHKERPFNKLRSELHVSYT